MTITYKGYELYQAFGVKIAAQTPSGQVLGMFSSLDEAMREIDRREDMMNYADPFGAIHQD